MTNWILAPHFLMAANSTQHRIILLGEGISHLIEDPEHVKALESLPAGDPPDDLVQAGVLVPAAEGQVPNSSASLWSSSGLPSDPIVLRSANIHALSSPGAGILEKALASVGIETCLAGEVDIVLVDDYMTSIMSEINV